MPNSISNKPGFYDDSSNQQQTNQKNDSATGADTSNNRKESTRAAGKNSNQRLVSLKFLKKNYFQNQNSSKNFLFLYKKKSVPIQITAVGLVAFGINCQ